MTHAKTQNHCLGKKPPQTGEVAVTMRTDVAAILRHYRQSLIEAAHFCDGFRPGSEMLRELARKLRISAGVEK